MTWKKTRPSTEWCVTARPWPNSADFRQGQKATLKRLRFEFWTYEYGHFCSDICIIVSMWNLYYSCPIICHQTCKCRFMQVRRSSLVGIKRLEIGRGLSNRLNIIIMVKLNFQPKQSHFNSCFKCLPYTYRWKYIPFVLLPRPRLMQPSTHNNSPCL